MNNEQTAQGKWKFKKPSQCTKIKHLMWSTSSKVYWTCQDWLSKINVTRASFTVNLFNCQKSQVKKMGKYKDIKYSQMKEPKPNASSLSLQRSVSIYLFLILPPLKITSPRQSLGTLGAQRLWQLNLQSKTEDTWAHDTRTYFYSHSNILSFTTSITSFSSDSYIRM